MSDSALLAMPTTTTLSVILTFTSLPSRVLMLSVGPSTASTVPRIRTVGGCWAHAVDASTVMSASDAANPRGASENMFGMVLPSLGAFSIKDRTPRKPGYSVTWSFRDGPKDQTRNLEIPGSRFGAPRNDASRHIGG